MCMCSYASPDNLESKKKSNDRHDGYIVHEDVVHVHMTDRKYNFRYLRAQNFQFFYKNGMIK